MYDIIILPLKGLSYEIESILNIFRLRKLKFISHCTNFSHNEKSLRLSQITFDFYVIQYNVGDLVSTSLTLDH